jgi:adenosyl cobinamide kinase/adenosyl cobinamide phosphate guanylyltransferase
MESQEKQARKITGIPMKADIADQPFEARIAYHSALKMYDWCKEDMLKEYRKELNEVYKHYLEEQKQQLIDRVCEWIKEHNGDYISIVPNDHLTNNFYDDLRKSMKGE